ncbi:MAG: glycine cleavage system aminomethyltransferase GcvT [Gammaproteobacteria bacterium]|nr:glycine cleavage system aminomethyltransferase GcvT [Gammaproteobacteria bacterium]MBQ0839187.1 glycine cleavage system aminomethyltransferase GcvT [Gammaproteobacteria bacterium]
MNSRTSLYAAHEKMGARIVDFSGWDMPLHYGSQIKEHHCVRRDCGMFDVSHMTVVDIDGSDTRDYLRYLLANDVAKITAPGQGLYSAMLNDRGGVVDDLIVYALPRGFRLVVNCATGDKDLAWMNEYAQGFQVALQQRDDLAIIAVQGPQAIARVSSVVEQTIGDRISALKPFASIFAASSPGGDDWQYARTGYTGEDGLEIILPSREAEAFWWQLHDAGVPPVGLAARDTLRLEAGLNLYGHEMDESISPLQANMAWTIAWQDAERDFVGRSALLAARDEGPQDKLVGLILTERGVLRDGQAVYIEGCERPGVITSGSFSPTLGYSIALARVPLQAGDWAEVKMRKKSETVRLIEPGFVSRGQQVFAAMAE